MSTKRKIMESTPDQKDEKIQGSPKKHKTADMSSMADISKDIFIDNEENTSPTYFIAKGIISRPLAPFKGLPDEILGYIINMTADDDKINIVKSCRKFWDIMRSKHVKGETLDFCQMKTYMDDDALVVARKKGKIIKCIDMEMALITEKSIHFIVFNFSSVRALKFADCSQLINEDLKLLGSLPYLCSLCLSRNKWLTDEGIKNLDTSKRLAKLQVVKCTQLTSQAALILKERKDNILHALDISHCPKVKDDAVQYLSDIKTLCELALSNVDTDESVKALSKLDLFTLRIYQGKFPSKALRHLKRINFVNLEFYHCKEILDDDINNIVNSCNPSRLRRLVLSHCGNITGETLNLDNAEYLETLILHSCEELKSIGFLEDLLTKIRQIDLTKCFKIPFRDYEVLLKLRETTLVAIPEEIHEKIRKALSEFIYPIRLRCNVVSHHLK
jgi:hypothetical protein